MNAIDRPHRIPGADGLAAPLQGLAESERTLLIVDDDAPLNQRLARAMERRGFIVQTADSVAGGIAAALSCALSAPSYADSSIFEQSYHTAVRTSDYNLDQPRGVAALYQRLRVAAGHVCGPRLQTATIGPSPGYERCVADAMAQAVARMDSEPLTSYYQQQLEHSRKVATAQ